MTIRPSKAIEARKDAGESFRVYILRAIKDWWLEHKSPPRVRDLAHVLKTSPSNVHHHLEILRNDGKLYTFWDLDTWDIVPKDISITFEEDMDE